MTKPTVLLVEDDPDVREDLAFLVADQGWHVESAANGAAALAVLEAHPKPNIILTDLMMPVMDGWELCEALQRSEVWNDIPVVVFSGASDLQREVPFGNIVGFLTKPIDIMRLMTMLAKGLHD